MRPSPFMGECWIIPGAASYSGIYSFSNRYLYIILSTPFFVYILIFSHSYTLHSYTIHSY